MKRVHVAAGIIIKAQSVLISKRLDHLHQGGLWEFPGGKVEPDEPVQDALARELKEELDIEVEQSEPFKVIRFDYPDKKVELDFWLVTKFAGTERGCEGQQIAWVDFDELMAYEFPEANRQVLEEFLKQHA